MILVRAEAGRNSRIAAWGNHYISKIKDNLPAGRQEGKR